MHALPVSAVGLRMDMMSFERSLVSALVFPSVFHTNAHCHAEVDELGTHGLSCVKNASRHSRHATVNSIVQRSLASAKIPSTLEPSDLFKSDDKRPDGMTIAPWKSGRSLVWDFTYPDTYATSYVQQSTSEAGAVENLAETRKKGRYAASGHTIFSYHHWDIGCFWSRC